MGLTIMFWTKSLLSLTALSLGLSLELAVIAIGSAQAGVSGSMSERNWQLSQFNPPDRGAPSTAVGGASRGGTLCDAITPLSPKDFSKENEKYHPYFGLTVSAKPVFFWHIQKTNDYRGKPVYFELKELGSQRDTDQIIYSQEFKFPTTPGVIGLNLPSGINLEENKQYSWYMEMECNGAIEVLGMDGFVERIAETPTLKNDLVMAETAVDQSKVYGEAGIWFDALNVLAQERRTADTPELEASWQALLQYLNIKNEIKDSVLNAEFIDCCSVDSASDASALTTHN
jgi:Domain of Unknown Function (DUF928)